MSRVGLANDRSGNPYRAPSFNGLSSSVDCGNNNSINLTSNCTFSVWLYLLAQPATNTHFRLYDKSGSSPYGLYISYLDTSGTKKIGMYYSSATSLTYDVTLQLNTWVHLACVHDDASDTDTIYINGASVSNTSGRTNNPGSQASNSYLGSEGGPSKFFNGYMADIRLYNRALSLSEVTALYNNQPVSSTGLVAHWQPAQVSHMGATTYEFADSTSASYGLQNVVKPWIALYDPANNYLDFYLFTHRSKNLSSKRDESGNIYELTMYPGNGLIYWGRITYPNLTLDSDSNLIPNCLEASVEGSIAKFLQSYGMVI
jgi:hypothetical protein